MISYEITRSGRVEIFNHNKNDEAIKANVHLFAITLKQLVGKSYLQIYSIHFISIGLGYSMSLKHTK